VTKDTTTLPKALTRAGVLRRVTSLRPSWPRTFWPQEKTLPSSAGGG
jgi:hypothetical protein